MEAGPVGRCQVPSSVVNLSVSGHICSPGAAGGDNGFYNESASAPWRACVPPPRTGCTGRGAASWADACGTCCAAMRSPTCHPTANPSATAMCCRPTAGCLTRRGPFSASSRTQRSTSKQPCCRASWIPSLMDHPEGIADGSLGSCAPIPKGFQRLARCRGRTAAEHPGVVVDE